MTAESILNGFKAALKAKLTEGRISEKVFKMRKKDMSVHGVWFRVDRKHLLDAVSYLCEKYPDPHFSVCSGYDMGKSVEMIYHFMVNYGVRNGETSVNIKVGIPKKDLTIDTITGLVPAAIISEREMQEMLGVRILKIPDGRRLFLDGTFPKGVYPWRRDEKGPHKLVKDIQERGSE